jgi:hypothetical protein
MKSIVSVLLAFFFFTSFLFSQDIIISNFDIDTDGWSVNGGNIYHHNSNGNPDGFIEFEDNQDGAGIFLAPNKFLGNLQLYKQGTLEFDLKNTNNNGQNMLWGYGNIKISSPTINAERNVVPLEYINDWTTFSIPLNSNEWGLTETGWDSLLSEITEISIQVDAQWDYYDRVGLDNFSILPNSSDVNDGLPNDKLFSYQLYQNYPNPFNPNTVISYQLRLSSNVTIKVYDILGNEIATLVNEYKPAGKYEVEFNSSSIGYLVSGTYFYQLRAGEYTAVKKMLLIK